MIIAQLTRLAAPPAVEKSGSRFRVHLVVEAEAVEGLRWVWISTVQRRLLSLFFHEIEGGAVQGAPRRGNFRLRRDLEWLKIALCFCDFERSFLLRVEEGLELVPLLLGVGSGLRLHFVAYLLGKHVQLSL